MKWKIWYDNGSTYTDRDGLPESAPLDGILAIAEEDATGRKQTYWGSDYYHWTGDGWRAGNLADLERWLRGVMPNLKYGRWTEVSKWLGIRDKVKKEWL